jgi:hypothetical protein
MAGCTNQVTLATTTILISVPIGALQTLMVNYADFLIPTAMVMK